MKHVKQFLLLFVFSFQLLYAQSEDKSLLTLERLFNGNEFNGENFGPARWIDDGKYYTTLEPSKDLPQGSDIIKYETKTGKREVMVSASLLIPKGTDKPLRINNYIWSPDKLMLMIFTNTARVWRYNTRGDYWVLNLETKELKKLGGSAKPSTLMFAKFSPDNKKAAYVSGHNIYCEEISTNKITQLTSDGSETIINGTFDWVYEEELSLRDGFRWSPDSKSIAYWQLDASGIGVFNLINYTDSIYSKIIPVQYPKVGTTNSACKVGVVGAEGGETIWMNVPGDPRNNYIARMDWHPDSKNIWLQHLNRPQNKLEIMLCDSRTGEAKTIFTETDDAWIDVTDYMQWINDGKYFVWLSDRDGWRHIYLISKDGKEIILLTPGKFDVTDIQKIDEADEAIYFRASPGNATQRYIFKTSLDGKNKIEKITPAELSGMNSYQISDGADFAFHTYSKAGTPPVIDLVELPSHKSIRTLVDNKKLFEKVNELKKSTVEFFQSDIGELALDCWMMKPYDFDPSKKYPVLFTVYGEPAAQTVLDRWEGTDYLWHLMLAQQGYIVISVDNRGTPSPRGREFKKSIYKKIGVLNSADQAKAAEAILKKFNFIDPDRVAVWGWSGGGSMTLNLMFRYPEIYKTGMAVAPVGDERLYDTIYQERYMGLLPENDSIYVVGSPVTFAHQLEGNLLIVHGTGDDNVHYQGTELVINELIKNNKPFTMMAYPNRTHGIYEGENTTLHLFSLLTRYLNDNTPAGGK
ncbi:MAG: S9 family peptidase [Ignavibacteriales bacterium]|nr:S9 family peptidase [Ignavibacteriales bacterium]